MRYLHRLGSADESMHGLGAPELSLPNTNPSPSAYRTSQNPCVVLVEKSQSRCGRPGEAKNASQLS